MVRGTFVVFGLRLFTGEGKGKVEGIMKVSNCDLFEFYLR